MLFISWFEYNKYNILYLSKQRMPIDLLPHIEPGPPQYFLRCFKITIEPTHIKT
jgi:hypothetical protein